MHARGWCARAREDSISLCSDIHLPHAHHHTEIISLVDNVAAELGLLGGGETGPELVELLDGCGDHSDEVCLSDGDLSGSVLLEGVDVQSHSDLCLSLEIGHKCVTFGVDLGHVGDKS